MRIATIVALLATTPAMADHDREIDAARAAKPGLSEGFANALLDGNLAKARTLVNTAWPKIGREAVDEMAAGEMLFNLADPEATNAFARAAGQLGWPEAYRELAIAQMRGGDCKAALASWKSYLDQVPDLRFWALVANCRAVLGDAKGAADAWRRADHANQHVAIEEAICYAHCDVPVDVRRGAIWARVRAKDAAAPAELLALDALFDVTWWNQGAPNGDRLEHDLARLQQFVDAASFADLKTFVRTVPLDKDAIGPALRKAGWLFGPHGKLPPSPLSHQLLAHMPLDGKAATELLATHSAELKKRDDIASLDVLAGLYQHAERWDDLGKLDKDVWERKKLFRFAASYVLRHVKSPDDPLFAKALADFPRASALQMMRIDMLEKANLLTVPALLTAIVAEFEQPMGLNAHYDSYRLKQYFERLAQLLSGKP